MNGTTAAILAIVVFLFLAFLIGKRNEKQARAELEDNLKKAYGKLPEAMPSYGGQTAPKRDMNTVAKYYRSHEADFSLDDITWHDLEMDKVYGRLRYTLSDAGDEVLYNLLRSPKLQDDFDSFEDMTSYFESSETARIQAGSALAKLRMKYDFSIYDYLQHLESAKTFSKRKHLLPDILALLALLGCFISFEPFFLVLLALLVFNLVTYFGEKAKADPYLATFSYCLKLIKGMEELQTLPDAKMQAALAPYKEDMEALESFRKGNGILLGGNQGSGNPLDILLDYVRMLTHMDLIKFSGMLEELRGHRDAMDHIITGIGMLDAELATSYFRASLKNGYCLPEFEKQSTAETELELEDLVHPCMTDPVPNSIKTGENVLLTGSNASGKSTFLRSVGIAAVLGQSIHTVPAKKYRGPMFRMYSSMAISDNLSGGDSYYMAEIKSLKRILDAAEGGDAILCLIDEVLRGTNTVERIAASSQILKSLCDKKIRCFAATHDLELTEILKGVYANYHFEGTVLEGDVRFDYRLKEGKAESRNAIALLGILGYDPSVVEKSSKMAENFLRSGLWEI